MSNLVWRKQRHGLHTAGENARVIRSMGGWRSGTWNPHTTRPWAAEVDGSLLLTAAGRTRTFSTPEAAKRAVETACLEIS